MNQFAGLYAVAESPADARHNDSICNHLRLTGKPGSLFRFIRPLCSLIC